MVGRKGVKLEQESQEDKIMIPVNVKDSLFEILEISKTFMISNEWFKYFKVTERNKALIIFIIIPDVVPYRYQFYPTDEYQR